MTPRRILGIVLSLCTVAINVAAQNPVFTTLYSFQGGSDGASPRGGVILDQTGALYGTTYLGGSHPCSNAQPLCGTVFKLVPAGDGSWAHTIIHNFSGPDGALPSSPLTFGAQGVLYGTTLAGGSGVGGTVFRMIPPASGDAPWQESVLYDLPGTCFGPRAPYGGVSIGLGGALLGTAYASQCVSPGVASGGTAFLLTPPAETGGNWTEDTVVEFNNSSAGDLPYVGLVELNGSWYGTTSANGQSGFLNGCGSVFRLAPPAITGGGWIKTTIHTFTGPDGCNPKAPLAVGPGGLLYGTTYGGGSGTYCTFPNGGCGTVFLLAPPASSGGNWRQTVIHNFKGFDGDGAYPSGSLVVASTGLVYGTTQYGGSNNGGFVCIYYGAENCGTVFKLAPPTTPGSEWIETIVYNFDNESIPLAGLTMGPDGTLYGTTSGSGTALKGTVFSLVP